MGLEHYQTVDPLKKEPQVDRGLFGVRLLIPSNLQYFIFSSIFFSQNAVKSPKSLHKTAEHY